MFSKKVKILPWVGTNYKKTKPKLLILGMSIYDKDKSRHVVNNYISGLIDHEWNYSFFTKIINVFNNSNHWDLISPNNYKLNPKYFWNDVAFYEYVQERMDFPKQKTPSSYWESSKKPFIEVLKKLKPDIVISLGYETYNNLPEGGKSANLIKYKGYSMEIWQYDILENKPIFVCKVQHPSSKGFKNDIWINLFSKFLNKYTSK